MLRECSVNVSCECFVHITLHTAHSLTVSAAVTEAVTVSGMVAARGAGMDLPTSLMNLGTKKRNTCHMSGHHGSDMRVCDGVSDDVCVMA